MSLKARSGFTLIELLVVIAIISILASILFPVFARARAKGRQAACLSNIRQILLAIGMYAQDYDETIVYGDADGNPTTLNDQWFNSIFPYTRNRQIMYCPDRKDMGPGYGLNYWASGRSTGAFWDAATKILVVDVPPECLNPDGKIAQTGRWWGNNADLTKMSYVPPYDDSFIGNRFPQRHNDGIVVGYVDGHTKWAREEQLSDPVFWDPGLATE